MCTSCEQKPFQARPTWGTRPNSINPRFLQRCNHPTIHSYRVSQAEHESNTRLLSHKVYPSDHLKPLTSVIFHAHTHMPNHFYQELCEPTKYLVWFFIVQTILNLQCLNEFTSNDNTKACTKSDACISDHNNQH